MMNYNQKQLGFTLVELMVVVAIVGILASIAYPSYTGFVVRSDRAEAKTELIRLANLEEQGFSDWRGYTENMVFLGEDATPYITQSDNYSIEAVVLPDTTTFTLTATAINGQERDTDCPIMTINEVGLKGPAAAVANDCWER